MKIRDIQISSQFAEDWEVLPSRIKLQANIRILNCLDAGKIISSMQPHRVRFDNEPGLWIGKIGKGFGAYRIIYRMLKDGTLYLERIFSHEEMEDYLR